MLSMTIDTNCIIAIENSEPAAEPLKRLVQAHRDGRVDLALVSVSASERQPGDTFMSNYQEFTDRVNAAGLSKLKVLNTIGYFGMSFWGVGLYGGTPGMLSREQSIHEALFPTIPFRWPEFAAANGLDVENDSNSRGAKNWRNAFCDRQMYWAHDHNDRDVFVTSDRNFARRLTGHPAFPNAAIRTPDQAAELLT